MFPHGFEPMPADQRTELRARVADLDDDPAARAGLRRWLLGTALDWDDAARRGTANPGHRLGPVRRARRPAPPPPGPARRRRRQQGPRRRVRLARSAPGSTAAPTSPSPATPGRPVRCSGPRRGAGRAGCPSRSSPTTTSGSSSGHHAGRPAASCRWRISDLADERILQAGFVSLLGARRFFAVDGDETLERLFERAADAEAEVTKGLGSSVRRSVELLVAAISRDDVAASGRVLAGVAADRGLRVGCHRAHAPRLPAVRRGAPPAPGRRPALGRVVLRADPARRPAHASRPATARTPSNADPPPGTACSPPSGPSTEAPTTTGSPCPPTAAACSTPIGSRSSRAAERPTMRSPAASTSGRPTTPSSAPDGRSPSTTAPCSPSSTPSSPSR